MRLDTTRQNSKENFAEPLRLSAEQAHAADNPPASRGDSRSTVRPIDSRLGPVVEPYGDAHDVDRRQGHELLALGDATYVASCDDTLRQTCSWLFAIVCFAGLVKLELRS